MKFTHPLSLTCLLLLTACGGNTVKQTLGLETQAPDEFRVVSRPPLSVPPQFSLRPPSTGDASENPYATDKQAQSLVTGQPVNGGNGETFVLKNNPAETAVVPGQTSAISVVAKTSAESQLLQNAGAASVDPTVRKTLVEEKLQKQQKVEEAPWYDFWSSRPDKKETTVDAKKEAERVKQNQDEGKPVTEGDTPVVKPKDKGVLGNILGY